MGMLLDRAKVSFDEFVQSPDFKGFELEDGQLVEKNVSAISSIVANKVDYWVTGHCLKHDLGAVMNPEIVYRCFPDSPDTGRKPDVSFIRKERLPKDLAGISHFRIVPDLVVEVISPNDKAYEVDRKTEQYLEVGVSLVWIINPEERIAHVYRADGTATRLRENDSLNGENVLPGFDCPLRDILLVKT